MSSLNLKQAMSWLEWAASGDDQYVVINAEIERLREALRGVYLIADFHGWVKPKQIARRALEGGGEGWVIGGEDE